MLSQAIWWVSIALEGFVVLRGVRAKLISRYPVFYFYVSFVLLQDLLRLLTYAPKSKVYSQVYWSTEFLGIFVGFAVLFEIYRVGLPAYPGVARMARNILAFAFAIGLAKGIAGAWSNPQSWFLSSTIEMERVLRMVEALAIVALAALFLFYSISSGKNLRGILLAYGLFIGARIVSLIFVPVEATGFWSYAYSASFPVALAIGLTQLWSYSETPVPRPAATRLESDYQTLAASTRRRLGAARGQLAKAVRS